MDIKQLNWMGQQKLKFRISFTHKEVEWSGYCPVHKALCYQSRSTHRLCMCMHSLCEEILHLRSFCLWYGQGQPTAVYAWDSRLHLPVTPVQLIRPSWYWPKQVQHNEWLCVTYRPTILKEIWFTDCSCTHTHTCTCTYPTHTKGKCTATHSHTNKVSVVSVNKCTITQITTVFIFGWEF